MIRLPSPVVFCLLTCSTFCSAEDGKPAHPTALPIAEIEPIVRTAPTSLDGFEIVATSLVDSLSLRYQQILAAPDTQQVSAAWRIFYAMRTDSVAHLQGVLALADGTFFGAATVPADLARQPVVRKKALFFSALQPLVAFHNSILTARYRRLLLLTKMDISTAEDRAYIADMGNSYRVTACSSAVDTLNVLLKKVGPIPPSLALAQAAIESGWGSSRFSRQGNNLYGQRVWSKQMEGLTADGATNARFRLAVFATIGASVGSYMHNLNSHPAYEALRQERALLRELGEVLSGDVLARGLGAYSTRGQGYIKDVRQMIRHNNLQRLDFKAQ